MTPAITDQGPAISARESSGVKVRVIDVPRWLTGAVLALLTIIAAGNLHRMATNDHVADELRALRAEVEAARCQLLTHEVR